MKLYSLSRDPQVTPTIDVFSGIATRSATFFELFRLTDSESVYVRCAYCRLAE